MIFWSLVWRGKFQNQKQNQQVWFNLRWCHENAMWYLKGSKLNQNLSGRMLHLQKLEDGGSIVGNGHISNVIDQHFVKTHRSYIKINSVSLYIPLSHDYISSTFGIFYCNIYQYIIKFNNWKIIFKVQIYNTQKCRKEFIIVNKQKYFRKRKM